VAALGWAISIGHSLSPDQPRGQALSQPLSLKGHRVSEPDGPGLTDLAEGLPGVSLQVGWGRASRNGGCSGVLSTGGCVTSGR
jgi:hypothetical protein